MGAPDVTAVIRSISPEEQRDIPGVIWPKDRAVTSDDGAEIAYTFLGPEDGPVVAFCAGLMCPDTWWHYLAPAVAAEGHRVLLFHYRGIGASGTPDNDHPEAYTIGCCARDLATIVEAEGIERLSILGHSMGVQVALEAYRQLGDKADGLIAITGPFASPLRSLYNAGPVWTYGIYHPIRTALALSLPPVRRLIWRTTWNLPMLQAGKLIRAFGPRTDESIVQSYLDHAAQIDPGVVLRIVAGMHEHDATDVLDEVKSPTLVIAGGKDPFTPPRQGKRMATRVPDSTFKVAPNGTHGTIIEYPELVNGWVLDFLDRVAPASG
jgi:3-oxoadipate enol-lactonase